MNGVVRPMNQPFFSSVTYLPGGSPTSDDEEVASPTSVEWQYVRDCLPYAFHLFQRWIGQLFNCRKYKFMPILQRGNIANWNSNNVLFAEMDIETVQKPRDKIAIQGRLSF